MNTEENNQQGIGDKVKSKSGLIRGLVIIAIVIAAGVYNSMDSTSLDHNNQGIESYTSGDFDSAVSQLEESIETAISKDAKMNANLNLAYVYISYGENDKALEYFTAAKELAAKNTYFLPLIEGEIHYAKGEHSLAEIKYLEAYDKDPKAFQTANALAFFYTDNTSAISYKPEEALKYALQAVENADQTNIEIAKENLALAYYQNYMAQETIDTINSMEIGSRYYMYTQLGYSYLDLENFDEAKKAFQKAKDGGVELGQEIEALLSEA